MKRQRLGQHYLTDIDVVRKIVSIAEVRSNEIVLEIGTGKGALTRELRRACGRLEGYEVDAVNLEATREAAGAPNVNLHLADVFDLSPSFDVLVSSLPYSRSADFVEWISQMKYDRAVVLLQEDFAKKITSPPGDRNYRAVSAIAQISSDIGLHDKVGRESFSPQPKVSSRIVTFAPRVRLRKPELILIKRLFALRRRRVSSALADVGIERASSHGDPRERVYQLPPEEVYRMVSGASDTRA
jgi:16S rRNA (adenine1518-N6/adenine1519-N6)-dimethyltransferase